MQRRKFLHIAGGAAAAAGALGVVGLGGCVAPGTRNSAVEQAISDELSVAELRAGLRQGRFTAHSLTASYRQRIEHIDRQGPRLNSVIELNPDAEVMARALDEEWRRSGPRGPWHGIPVLLKDNIDTGDRMTTTAGSLALVGSVAPQDSFLAARLRAAGASCSVRPISASGPIFEARVRSAAGAGAAVKRVILIAPPATHRDRARDRRWRFRPAYAQ